MKKSMYIAVIIVLLLSLSGCQKHTEHEIRITIPAGCTDEFVYSDEQISPSKSFDFYGGAGIHVEAEFNVPEDRGIIIRSADSFDKIYASSTTKDILLLRKTWYQIGIMGENRTDEDIEVSVILHDVDFRISQHNNRRLSMCTSAAAYETLLSLTEANVIYRRLK